MSDYSCDPTPAELEYMHQRETDPEFRAWDDEAIRLHVAEQRAERERRGGFDV